MARSVGVLVRGGVDREVCTKAKGEGTIGSLATNHSPYFAPVIHPTVEAAVETLVVTTLAWLGKAVPGSE